MRNGEDIYINIATHSKDMYGYSGILTCLEQQMKLYELNEMIKRKEFKKIKKELKKIKDDDERINKLKEISNNEKYKRVSSTLITYLYLKKIFEKSNIHLINYRTEEEMMLEFNDVFDDNFNVKDNAETFKEYEKGPERFKLFTPKNNT